MNIEPQAEDRIDHRHNGESDQIVDDSANVHPADSLRCVAENATGPCQKDADHDGERNRRLVAGLIHWVDSSMLTPTTRAPIRA